jgi:hypothetical protein
VSWAIHIWVTFPHPVSFIQNNLNCADVAERKITYNHYIYLLMCDSIVSWFNFTFPSRHKQLQQTLRRKPHKQCSVSQSESLSLPERKEKVLIELLQPM